MRDHQYDLSPAWRHPRRADGVVEGRPMPGHDPGEDAALIERIAEQFDRIRVGDLPQADGFALPQPLSRSRNGTDRRVRDDSADLRKRDQTFAQLLCQRRQRAAAQVEQVVG